MGRQKNGTLTIDDVIPASSVIYPKDPFCPVIFLPKKIETQGQMSFIITKNCIIFLATNKKFTEETEIIEKNTKTVWAARYVCYRKAFFQNQTNEKGR